MDKVKAIQILRAWDQQHKYVFTIHNLHKLFPEDKPKTFRESLGRLVKAGLLVRACRGIYVNPFSITNEGFTIEHIARALRRGEFNSISLESMLIEICS